MSSTTAELLVLPASVATATTAATTPETVHNDGSPLSPFTSPGQQLHPRRKTFGNFATLTGLFATLFIAALNVTVVATAVPTICAHLHSDLGSAWIGGAYLLGNAAAAPIWSKLSDIWGRKPILLSIVAMYFVSSILCATATTMKVLIVSRALQGTAGGGILSMVNITISDLYSMRNRALLFGLSELVWAVAGGIGPILGGTFAQYLTWRWIFWMNLPIAGITFVLLLLYLDVHNPRTKAMDGIKAVDWLGSASVLGVMGMLLLGLNFGGVTYPWSSPTVIGLLVGGSVMAVAFVLVEARFARYPIVPMEFFRQKSTLAILILGFVQDYTVIAAEYYLPLYFQSAKGSSPLRSGLLILPTTLSQAFTGIFAGVYIHQTGRYMELIWAGVLLLALGNGLYIHLNSTSSIGEIATIETLAGIGAGLLFEPPIIALQALKTQEDTATAIGTLGFVRSIGNCLSVLIGGLIFQHGVRAHVPRLIDQGLSQKIGQELSVNAAALAQTVQLIPDGRVKAAVLQAFTDSLRLIWIHITCLSAFAVVACGFISNRVLSKEHTETRTGLNVETESAR